MQGIWRFRVAVAAVFIIGLSAQADQPVQMKFNEVREVAPGVFFRYASISATDPKVPFGGCNNIWVVFDEYVVVFDANFPKEASDVIAAIRKTTQKPIRYVIDSHHHGDHAYGNSVWAKEGASIIAHRRCFEWLKTKGIKEFADAGKGPTGRPDIAATMLKVPDVIFDDKLVLDDGAQRVEVIYLGHCHTPGDAGLYLPKHGILCTGDACVNGAYNYTGHSNTKSWIENLQKVAQKEIKLILPGHGLPAGRELLDKQAKYFTELRQQVKKGIENCKEEADIIKAIDILWYKEWTGVSAKDRVENIKHVYAELIGSTMAWEFVEDYGIYESRTNPKESPNWSKPKRIVVPNLMPARLHELRRIAPEVSFVAVKSAEEAEKEAADADAVLGFCTEKILNAGGKLRWVQTRQADLDPKMYAKIKAGKVPVTCVDYVSGADVAERAFALLLGLTRQYRDLFGFEKEVAVPLDGSTMVIVGSGPAGLEIARRAHAFGMVTIVIETNGKLSRKNFIRQSAKLDQLLVLLPQADVVVLACPLTERTAGLLGKKHFQAMKPSSYLINVGSRAIVEWDVLSPEHTMRIMGIGEEFYEDDSFWPRKIFGRTQEHSDHITGNNSNPVSPQAQDRQWRFFKENVRRFVSGEPLLCVMND